MSIRPVASTEATHPPTRILRAAALLGLFATAALLLGALPTAHAAAEDAQSILKKVSNTYATAKTFQAQITMRRSGKGQDGKSFSITTLQQIKYKSPNLLLVKSTTSIVGGPAGKGHPSTQTMVSDGHSILVYFASNKQYMRQNRPLPGGLSSLITLPSPQTPGLSMLAPTTLQGHTAYVLQIMPQLPPNLPAAQRAQIKPAQIFIDKQTYHLLKIAINGGPQPYLIQLDSQVFNQAIPDSTFHFTLPAGAKEYVPRSPGMMGSAPGGGPGPAPR
jgi:outer membrane lipoprotein-sorting protein